MKTIATLSVMSCITMLAGCATFLVPSDKATPIPIERVLLLTVSSEGNSGTLDITRDSGFIGNGCYMGFYIDGKLAAKFDTNERAKFYVKPGDHLIGVGLGNLDEDGLCKIKKGYSPIVFTTIAAGEVKKYILMLEGDGVSVELSNL